MLYMICTLQTIRMIIYLPTHQIMRFFQADNLKTLIIISLTILYDHPECIYAYFNVFRFLLLNHNILCNFLKRNTFLKPQKNMMQFTTVTPLALLHSEICCLFMNKNKINRYQNLYQKYYTSVVEQALYYFTDIWITKTLLTFSLFISCYFFFSLMNVNCQYRPKFWNDWSIFFFKTDSA